MAAYKPGARPSTSREEFVSSVAVMAFVGLLAFFPGSDVETPHSETEVLAVDGQSMVVAADYAYRDYSQMRSELLALEAAHPAISKVYDIGDSWEKAQSISDRDILALKISDNVSSEEAEPEVLITALHHAREWTTSEIVLELAMRLVDGYGTDLRLSWLVDNREIWLVPVVNPDGLDYALSTDEGWRKNRHLNADLTFGVDLNRNYDGASNGDPLGDWGGVGASTTPDSDVYCGEYPFSEPETQAIRDLVLGHDFTISIDFHSFGNLVLWPWGYTANRTADHGDLSRIGAEFGSVNGYLSEQSITLYPTTGDSADWMYGHAGVYAFAIEVGDEFHPANATTVAQIIAVNTETALLGIEVAGDRQERGFNISHVPYSARNYSGFGFPVDVAITADRGVNDSSVELVHSADGEYWSRTPMINRGGNDTYSATLPPADIGSTVAYYFTARDNAGVLMMSPQYAPYGAHSFLVSSPLRPPKGVDFSIPSQVDGSFDWSLSASIWDYAELPGMTAEFIVVGSGDGVRYDVPRTNGSNYTLVVPPGMRLGSYLVRLSATVGGETVWNSTGIPLEVVDQTAPTISGVSGVLIEEHLDDFVDRYIRIDVACSDCYGVSTVRLVYRIDGGEWVTSTRLADSNDASRQNWSFLILVNETGGVLEYRVEVEDSSNTANYPSGQSTMTLTFLPLDRGPVINGTTVAIVVALSAVVVAVAVFIVILVRRQ